MGVERGSHLQGECATRRNMIPPPSLSLSFLDLSRTGFADALSAGVVVQQGGV
jgi:hypothetical protein